MPEGSLAAPGGPRCWRVVLTPRRVERIVLAPLVERIVLAPRVGRIVLAPRVERIVLAPRVERIVLAPRVERIVLAPRVELTESLLDQRAWVGSTVCVLQQCYRIRVCS